MKDYIHLTPSEVAYFITEGRILQIEHFYFTFLDLLLKRVIEVPKGLMVKPDLNKNFELETFIGVGPNFIDYSPLPHESIFTGIFNDNIDLRTTILNHLKYAYKQHGFLESINDFIKSYEDLSDYHNHPKFFNLIKSDKLNGKGLILSSKLEQSLIKFEHLNRDAIKPEDFEKAVDILDTKIVIIKDFNYDLFFKWCKDHNNSELPFTFEHILQDKLNDWQFRNILAIEKSFGYFYEKMIEAIEDENDMDIGYIALMGI